MENDNIKYMSHAIELAKRGQGRTSPNPCVGAVIVKNDKIVGEGYHKKAGTPHAEVHAIADAGSNAKGSTIYVTLEPCNHTGKTPPCTQAILRAGISKVIVGMPDPNPTVEGGGCDFLAANGVATTCGILENECRSLNYPFIKHISSKLPWVAMKAGMSLDAKISYSVGSGGRITGSMAHRLTHQLRDTFDAILVGVETVRIDDPSLTTRLPKKNDARDPVRVVLDTTLRMSPDAKLLTQKSDASTIIFCCEDAPDEKEHELQAAGALVKRVQKNNDKSIDLQNVISELGAMNITSVLVEGGAKIHSSLLQENLVDEVYMFIAPFFIGNQGTPLLDGFKILTGKDNCPLHSVSSRQIGEDTLIHGYFSNLAK